ncbi:pilus assembly protein TadG-related protein [Sphingorhabdus sp.]|uniref:pilus assembly protein TadG-related protein n=1 Tax=Sphingorhabdus sp. TaxID=1902408 RepID=UPI0032B7182F
MIRSIGKKLWREESGAVASVYALALPALVAIGGIAFDYARLAAMDTELQNAADQAALAAVTQLDGKAGACARASATAVSHLANRTVYSNVGGTPDITVTGEATCDATGKIKFWQNKAKTTAATTDANARFVEVTVNARTARYALTPIVGAFNSGAIDAAAMAGLGSSVCKVPPIMICSPDPSVPFDANGRVGQGVVATGHSPGSGSNKDNANQGGSPGTGSNTTWAPGDFGFLQVNDPDANNRNAALLRALAYENPPTDCVQIDENRVSTGNPQGLYDAINTRFGIYDFNNNGGGNVLSTCEGGDCPPAPNVRMDYVKQGNGNNSCKIKRGTGGNGFSLPDSGSEFKPVNPGGAYNPVTALHSNTNAIAAMGLPRDNCHYTSFNTGSTTLGFCPGGNGRFGSGEWARQDYFTKYHNSNRPANWQTISRYQAYLWELSGNMPTGGAPTCGLPASNANRRLLTVAVVSNCSSLNGASQPVVIDEWVDVFLVEPASDDTLRWNAFKDAIYMEIIGKSTVAGAGVFGNQTVRRDVPYLVE